MIRAARFASALVAFASMLAPSCALARQQFHGKLNSHLSIGVGYIPLMWKQATPAQRAALGSLITASDQVWTGNLSFGPAAALHFKAALVKTKSGSYCLYVDRNHTGRLTAADRITIHPGTKSQPMPSATFTLPLQSGPFKTFPIAVMVPAGSFVSTGNVPYPILESAPGGVKGIVQLPHRKLLVSYQYNLAEGKINLAKAKEGMDLNGNGKIDFFGEQNYPSHGRLPVFHLGHLFLRTRSVNLKTGAITLDSLPASALAGRIFWEDGETLPNFPLTPFTGPRTTFAKIKGKYTIVDFWASWCEPCMAQFPVLKKAYAKYHSRGLQILGINGDKSSKAALSALAKVHAPWPEARGGKLVSRFQITGWPSEMILDANRKVVASSSNQSLEGEFLNKALVKVFPAK